PHLPAGSTIINSTSVQGYNPSPMIINYASTKFAIIGFTKALAHDLAPRGIRVNAVAPGPVWTPLQVSDGQPPEKLDGFGESSWLGRTSQPVEQAPAYVFLASPESSFGGREVINANGGPRVPCAGRPRPPESRRRRPAHRGRLGAWGCGSIPRSRPCGAPPAPCSSVSTRLSPCSN